MLRIDRVLGSRLEAAFSEEIHRLEHSGAVDVVNIPVADLARRRLLATTRGGEELAIALPRTLAEALRLLRESKPLVDLFGDRFVLAYTAVKEAEYETFAQVISSWEREHLLLNI